MNKKGFTLIELLACLVILSIIMVIAVPSTLSILDKNKKDTYISDAKKFVTLAESEFRINSDIEYPTGNTIVVMSLKYLNNGDILEDPNGNTYNVDDSYVAIAYQGSETSYNYKFSVQLYANASNENRGLTLTKSDDLIGDARYTKVVKDNFIGMSNCSSISQVVLGNTSGTCIYYK